MILPNKHIKLSNSLLNLGAILLDNISGTQTVSLLWNRVKNLPDVNNFERFTLGLDLLYTLDLIELKDGLIMQVGR